MKPSANASPASARDAITAALSEKPDGVLEALAESHGVSYRTVLECLPPDQRRKAPSAAFEDVWKDLTEWGTIMFIVHTINGVFETKAPLPAGSFGRGYFNIHGASPIGGHLRIERLDGVYFVDRPFFGRRSCSIQFIDQDGDAMFKVFVGRDPNREMLPEQVRRFEVLRGKFSSE